MPFHSSPRSTLLITGATGFLGGALAAELLSTPQWDNVLLLVRGEDPAHAYQRAVRSLARFTSDIELLGRLRADQVIAGDFTQPAAFIEDLRLRDVSRVVHCAALTSFGANRRAFSTNVDGTLRFVHHLRQVATIERFIHVSTAMICGDRGGRLAQEDAFPNSRVNHLVKYTESKAEAERLLRLTLPGFPLIVVRPSIVVGHTQLGCAPSGSIYWTFRMADALNMITCAPEARMDVVPVDYVAQALQHLILKPQLMNSTYHISAGADACVRWTEIAEAFASTHARVGQAAVGDGGVAVATGAGYRSVDFSAVAARKPEFDALFGDCNKKFMLKALELYSGFAELDTVFDATRLRMEGMPPPPRFTDYLPLCERTSANQTIAEQGLIDFA